MNLVRNIQAYICENVYIRSISVAKDGPQILVDSARRRHQFARLLLFMCVVIISFLISELTTNFSGEESKWCACVCVVFMFGIQHVALFI